MFFFKRNKIVLDCFTTRVDVHQYFPIIKSSKNMPNWWKTLPESFPDTQKPLNECSTMRHCAGFVSYFTSGISVPLWSDVNVLIDDINDEIRWQYSDMTSTAAVHDSRQFGEYLLRSKNSFYHLKLNSPWFFKCKEDIKWVFVGNSWSIEDPSEYIIPPGVVDFKYQSTTNINILFPGNNVQRVVNMKASTPIVQYFPMTEREIVIKNHHIDDYEMQKIQGISQRNFFTKSYYKHKKILKNQESKCPFHGFFN